MPRRKKPPTNAILLGLGVVLLTAAYYGWGMVLIFALMLAVLGLMRSLAMRQIGGFTGDVLGATQQLGEIVVLLGIVALAQ